MTDIQTRNTQYEGAMPRREFIRKSLIASVTSRIIVIEKPQEAGLWQSVNKLWYDFD
jgi:hypothetical protein